MKIGYITSLSASTRKAERYPTVSATVGAGPTKSYSSKLSLVGCGNWPVELRNSGPVRRIRGSNPPRGQADEFLTETFRLFHVHGERKGTPLQMPQHPNLLTKRTDSTAGAFQQCLNPDCAATFSVDEAHFSCPRCSDLVDVIYEWDRLKVPKSLEEFAAKWATRQDPLSFSGVWRFRELLPFAPPDQVVTIGEGQTLLQRADKVGRYVNLDQGCLWLQYEGMNPSGSFKDNGMTAAFTHARMVERDASHARAPVTRQPLWRSTVRRPTSVFGRSYSLVRERSLMAS